MRLLAISGSLRARSSNTILLEAAARLAPAGTAVGFYRDLGGLPHFNPDLDTDDPPPSVRALRRAVEAADGLLISSPEYAHGMAGTMKNALDWLVRSLEFPFKPVVLLNASQRSAHAWTQMREVLLTMSARFVDEASITVPLGGRTLDADGLVADPDLAEPLRAAMALFVAAIATHDIGMSPATR